MRLPTLLQPHFNPMKFFCAPISPCQAIPPNLRALPLCTTNLLIPYFLKVRFPLLGLSIDTFYNPL